MQPDASSQTARAVPPAVNVEGPTLQPAARWGDGVGDERSGERPDLRELPPFPAAEADEVGHLLFYLTQGADERAQFGGPEVWIPVLAGLGTGFGGGHIFGFSRPRCLVRKWPSIVRGREKGLGRVTPWEVMYHSLLLVRGGGCVGLCQGAGRKKIVERACTPGPYVNSVTLRGVDSG